MDRISGLPDELLVKILSLLPHYEVVSTSILSKRWESLWLWKPSLEFAIYHGKSDLPLGDFITKNLSLLKPPVLESFQLYCFCSTFQPEDIKHWVETSVSRCVRELDIDYYEEYSSLPRKHVVVLPSSLYSCKSLVTLKLTGNITVDVPQTVDLPCLKTLELRWVTFSNKDSLQLLLSYCHVLEDLILERYWNDNVESIIFINPSLMRLSINGVRSLEYEIVTPSLKYFKINQFGTKDYSNFKLHMPNVEEADLFVDDVEMLFESITSIKRLSLSLLYNHGDHELLYRNGIVFNQLEHLELTIRYDYWYKILFRLLKDSPKLRVLKIRNHIDLQDQEDKYEVSPSWKHDVPKCLLESLETFEFVRYKGRREERDVVNYILKNAAHLKSSSIELLHSILKNAHHLKSSSISHVY